MTEQEWLSCDNVELMLSSLDGKATERKVRLFAAACGRSVWHLLSDDWCKHAVEIAERLADGKATEQERADAYALALELMGSGDPPNDPLAVALGTLEKANPKFDGPTPLFAGAFGTASAAAYTLANGKSNYGSPAWEVTLAQAECWQLALLRDIFGPLPFRPVVLDSARLAWNGGTIPKLAQTIYDERAFNHLPALADALQLAGGDNTELVSHCRGQGPHVRGCWVVDLLLGKD